MLVFLQQAALMGAGQWESGLQVYRPSPALALVEASDEPVSVFGALDCFDNDV